MSSPRPDDAAIREQAYYFWEQDGRPDGREAEYWMRATIVVSEKPQMDALTKASPKKAVKTAKTEAAPKLKAAASKAKAPPAKSAKAESKPKKK
jgi:hypothetical protein